LADARLRGKVDSERFVEGRKLRLALGRSTLKSQPRPDAPQITEALMGEDLLVFDTQGDFAFVQLLRDRYVGWIGNFSLLPDDRPLTHQVTALHSHAYVRADAKANTSLRLSFGTQLTGVEVGDFVRVTRSAVYSESDHEFWVPRQHLAAIGWRASDFVAVAERFIGSPYVWGGKTADGVDCSGLVQIALHAAGIECPRDSDMQVAELGVALPETEWDRLKRGDLVCWTGHIGIMTDARHLLHANAHAMAVSREPLRTVIGRAQANGSNILTIRRIPAYN
jgi:cell wall-associated NlpC family hydrolase